MTQSNRSIGFFPFWLWPWLSPEMIQSEESQEEEKGTLRRQAGKEPQTRKGLGQGNKLSSELVGEQK